MMVTGSNNSRNSSPSTTDGEDDEISSNICLYCGDKPCFWISMKDDIVSSTIRNVDNYLKPNSYFRKRAYQMYVFHKYGRLGKGNRVRVPLCVLEGVRSVWPESDANGYMGHKDSFEQTT